MKGILAASIFFCRPFPTPHPLHLLLSLKECFSCISFYCVPVDIKNVYLQVKSAVLQLQRVATRGVALRPAASCCYHGNRRWMATGPPPLTVLTEEEEMMKESGVLRSCCCIQSCFSTTFKIFLAIQIATFSLVLVFITKSQKGYRSTF